MAPGSVRNVGDVLDGRETARLEVVSPPNQQPHTGGKDKFTQEAHGEFCQEHGFFTFFKSLTLLFIPLLTT